METSRTTMILLAAIHGGEHLIYNSTERAELVHMMNAGLVTVNGMSLSKLGLNYVSMPFELTRKGLSLLGIKPEKKEKPEQMADAENTDGMPAEIDKQAEVISEKLDDA